MISWHDCNIIYIIYNIYIIYRMEFSSAWLRQAVADAGVGARAARRRPSAGDPCSCRRCRGVVLRCRNLWKAWNPGIPFEVGEARIVCFSGCLFFVCFQVFLHVLLKLESEIWVCLMLHGSRSSTGQRFESNLQQGGERNQEKTWNVPEWKSNMLRKISW